MATMSDNSQEKFGSIPDVNSVDGAYGSRNLDDGISQRLSWSRDSVESGLASETNSDVPTYRPDKPQTT